MAREFDLSDALVLVRRDQNAADNDYDAAIDSAAGWTDLSNEFDGFVTINLTRESRRFRPIPPKRRGKVLSGTGAGTSNFRLARKADAAGDEGAAFFDAVEADPTARFSVCIQPFRTPLLAGNNVVPAASASNPQYLYHTVLTSLDQWGSGGEDQAFMAVNSEVDDDYGVYRA